MWAIVKKEFQSYFLSPIGYIYIGIFLLMCSIVFYANIFWSIILGGYVDFSNLFKNSMFISVQVILIFIIPLLTMRMFSEERKNGTEQLLLTSPRSVTSIVLEKFIAAALVVLVSVALTLIYYAILCYFGEPQLGKSLVAILGFALLALAYISFGMFASSLTENQIIAAVISIAFFMLSWFLPGFSSAFVNFSLMDAFYMSFVNGAISIQNLVLLVSFTVLFIIFTIMVIQRRKSVK